MTIGNALRRDIHEYNQSVERGLSRAEVGISFVTYRAIKATVQLVGACLGGYALYLGVPPSLGLLLITIMVIGPEGIDTVLANWGFNDTDE